MDSLDGRFWLSNDEWQEQDYELVSPVPSAIDIKLRNALNLPETRDVAVLGPGWEPGDVAKVYWYGDTVSHAFRNGQEVRFHRDDQNRVVITTEPAGERQE